MISIGKAGFYFRLGMISGLLMGTVSDVHGTDHKTEPGDSVERPVFVINPRINSAGHFPFSGSLINHHVNADVNLLYARHVLGFFIFKSYDIEDPHSIVNYFQPGVFATAHVAPNFRVRAFFGYIFSQTEGFRDSDSDYYTAATLYWDISNNIRVEHTALYYDYNINQKLANRLLIFWQEAKFKVSLYLWHRYVFDDGLGALSSSLALTFPIIKLSERASLELTSSYLGYLTSYKPDYARRDGFLFTLAVPVALTGH